MSFLILSHTLPHLKDSFAGEEKQRESELEGESVRKVAGNELDCWTI